MSFPERWVLSVAHRPPRLHQPSCSLERLIWCPDHTPLYLPYPADKPPYLTQFLPYPSNVTLYMIHLPLYLTLLTSFVCHISTLYPDNTLYFTHTLTHCLYDTTLFSPQQNIDDFSLGNKIFMSCFCSVPICKKKKKNVLYICKNPDCKK